MPAPERTPHLLLRHLDSLYHLARLVTPSSREAAELVEATGRRATQLAGEGPADRAALLRLLLDVHAARHDELPNAHLPNLQAGLHRRLARHHLQRALPAALAVLPGEQQLLLLLTEVERLDAAEAGRVLDMEAEAASEQLPAAHRMLHDVLYRQAGEAERELLRDHATPEAVADGLRHLLRSERATVPPRLRKTVSGWVASEPEDEPAPPRKTQPASPEDGISGRERRFHRALISLLLILAAGLAGWLATELIDRPAEATAVDLLQRSAAHAERVQPTLETGETARAEAFALETTGQHVDVPSIRGAQLLGAGTDVVAPGVRVPVFLYRGTTEGSSVALYTYSYTLLDHHADRLRLAPEVRRRIEDEQRYGSRTLDDRQVLVWRRRDDIYVAVTPNDATDLRQRLEWKD